MRASVRRCLMCLTLSLLAGAARARAEPRSGDGEVALPYADWDRLLRRATPAAPQAPDLPLATLARSVRGEVRDGVLRAALRWRFLVPGGGPLRVAVLEGEASITSTSLDGRPTTLVRSGDGYVLELPRPGVFDLKLDLVQRAAQEGFAQRLTLKLPAGPRTSVSLSIDQQPVIVRLASGELITSTQQKGQTKILAYTDSAGRLDLSWSRRRLSERQAAQLSCRVLTLLTVEESAVHGLARFELAAESSAADHLDLQLPAGAQVLKVSGDEVLQWQVTSGPERKLRILFRGPVERAARFQVGFQTTAGGGVAARQLPVLLPADPVSYRASLGVLAGRSLEVKLEQHQGASLLPPAEWPPELVELTPNPLLFVLTFSRLPSLAVTLSRRQRLALSGAIVDELHAASVLLGDGTELTKLRLQIRNNTRQHLRLRLPSGSTLLRVFVDGQTVQPGLVAADPSLLLVALRQSQPIDRTVLHRVADGETPAEIANLYFSDPGRWPLILRANQLADPRAVRAGQELRIPRGAEVTVEESAFALELAYRRGGEALGPLGRRRLALPELDLEVMRLHWHLFLPRDKYPLHFAGSLKQQTLVRHDLARRIRDFVRQVLQVRDVWAAPAPYRSILQRRRAIHDDDAAGAGLQSQDDAILFPLVGERYRFTSLLQGHQAPVLTVSYLERWMVTATRWSALLLAAICIWLCLRSRRWWSRGAALSGLLPLALVGYGVPGVYRRLLWGAALGVAAALFEHERNRVGERLRALVSAPWTLAGARWHSLISVLLALGLASVLARFPLLLSTGVLSGLLVVWARRQRRSLTTPTHSREVSDARPTPVD